MDASDLQIRRATVDDLPGLNALWQEAGFSTPELEKRVTEFHLVTDADGRLVGALGFRVAGQYAQLHHEAFLEGGDEDRLRPLLWERIELVARHRGIVRLWTQLTAPFWGRVGFVPPEPDEKERLPTHFGHPDGEWRTLKLRDEAALDHALDREINLLKIQNQEQNERLMRGAKVMKSIAILLGFVLLLVIALGLFMLAKLGRSGALSP